MTIYLNQLIKVLQQAKKQYGDVPVSLQDNESGYNVPIMEIQKVHPRSGPYSGQNRSEPVNGIVLHDHSSKTMYSVRSGSVRSDLALWPSRD